MRTGVLSILGLCVLLPIVGCTDDDSSGQTTRAAAGTASSASTELAATPSSTSTNESATVPTATTVLTPSSTTPTTTADATAPTKAAVAAAIVQSRQDYLYAVGNYDAPDALEVLARTWSEGGPSWNLVTSTMQSMQASGYRLRPNPAVPDASTVEGEVTLLDGPPATRAEVQVCTVSSDVVFKPGGAPDGTDLIVNDDVVARRTRVSVVFQDGAWKAYEGTILGSWEGEQTCPAG
jgi:hypothetical protein